MKHASFHDMLKDKMAQTASPSEPTVTASVSESFFDISPLFQVSLNIPKTWPAQVYPKATVKTEAIAASTPPSVPAAVEEPTLAKMLLKEDELSKWVLFEKVMDCELGDSVSRSRIKAAFRNFAKKNHPDMGPNCDPKHFAFGVRVKNEMLDVLRKYI